ncbi:MAG: hypothetical protein Q8S73_37175 [Deltaproteobacteria bacterium]|nr:hypothetical protein [Myxococcales bacterium]MDP3219794.1 hypothetical protein [Deltaproteobacteria bacterium]
MSTESSPTPGAPTSEPTPTPATKPRPLWRSLKEDASFRATFLAVFVIPAALMGATIAWVVRAMALQ